MNKAIEQFRLNIKSAQILDSIYNSFDSNVNIDLSEILRAELVLTVSALDCFIHDIVRLGTIEIYNGNKRAHKDILKPRFPIDKLNNLLTKTKYEQLTIEYNIQNCFIDVNTESKIEYIRTITTESKNGVDDITLHDMTVKNNG